MTDGDMARFGHQQRRVERSAKAAPARNRDSSVTSTCRVVCGSTSPPTVLELRICETSYLPFPYE